MDDIEIKYEFNDSWDLLELDTIRNAVGSPLGVKLKFTRDSECKMILLSECRDYGIVESLLEADSIMISKVSDTQADYGTIRVECFGETFAEYFCDEVHELDT